jgi:hypothetical protein
MRGLVPLCATEEPTYSDEQLTGASISAGPDFDID